MTKPNNRSGKHKTPRRQLGVPPEQWDAIDAAAERLGVPWYVWAGQRLIEATRQSSLKRLKPSKSTRPA